MKLSRALGLVLGASVAVCAGVAFAQEHHEGHDGHEGHEAPPQHRVAAPRPPAPAFHAHPPGQHPHGPIVRAHPVRVLAPRVVVRNAHPWHHWEHPEFNRPVYYWNWGTIHTVTCTAEDSYGDQYPISESAWAGFGLENMTQVEDDALDRCYEESGQDTSCYLATCAHF